MCGNLFFFFFLQNFFQFLSILFRSSKFVIFHPNSSWRQWSRMSINQLERIFIENLSGEITEMARPRNQVLRRAGGNRKKAREFGLSKPQGENAVFNGRDSRVGELDRRIFGNLPKGVLIYTAVILRYISRVIYTRDCHSETWSTQKRRGARGGLKMWKFSLTGVLESSHTCEAAFDDLALIPLFKIRNEERAGISQATQNFIESS